MKNNHAEKIDANAAFDASNIAVNCVQFDDEGREASNQTVPLERFFNDYGQTSEMFLQWHQKRTAKR